MKKIFLILFLSTLFFACEKDKDKDPAPELSAQVVGTYKITELKIDGTKQPLEGAVITVQLDKFSSEVVTGKMKLKLDGVSEPDEDLGSIALKNAGSTGIDLYEGTEKIGSIKSGKLNIFVVYEGQEIEMIGDKQ
ncbi:hypothetical protein [Dyadobacter sp. CY326]|uniref:hypothetical protein n=1 Tax=Dyadobacter sp. CY326 TaxID=2907300 RepID=UPI001F1AABEB|nr:hypothetical protein [Dyadobacter sp. CY326]MCE7067957.1 hypothetical protein [Dyadobacter sp. CY326]